MNLYATCCESAASSLAVTQYPPFAPNRNQVVKLLPQPGHLLGRTQIMPGGTQNQIHKTKQPQQILPKPIPPKTSPQKQSVPRLNTAMPQQTPLLINQPQAQSPALLLNQVLTSGAPVLVQPAGPGGTVHLMLRTPTPTLQSGPGPPQNKMIIANAAQPQPQATVLIQNRQQVVRFMTAQGPMQLQQIQTPSGPQFIAIPQNQSLSFPANSVLVQGPTANALQLQQSSGNPLQLRQSPSTLIQSNSFPQTSLSSSGHQISIPNQLFTATPATTVGLKGDEKSSAVAVAVTGADNAICLPGSNDQKKIVIDNKINSKKNVNVVTNTNTIGNNFNTGNHSNTILGSSNGAGIVVGGVGASIGCNVAGINLNNTNLTVNNSAKKVNQKPFKTKSDEEVASTALNRTLNKSFVKSDNLIGTPVSVPTTTAQKNLTSSLRQIRPGALANRNKQNQSVATSDGTAKDKTLEDTNSKSMSNLTRIIDSVASNTEHLISSPPKIDNLTATINSVAENIKSPTPDDIMSKLSLTDVFLPGNKSLNLNKRPNLTIVQKEVKVAGSPDLNEGPNVTINRLMMSPSNSNSGSVDFESNFGEALEMRGITTSAGVQTLSSQGFVMESTVSATNQEAFQNQDDNKKGKKKPCGKKKGKKEESRVDLWDLMKSAGIGDDEFDDPTDISNFSQDPPAPTIAAEPLEISDNDLIAQIQSASQLPGGIRVVVGEDGRPVIINGGNVLIPENVPGVQNVQPVQATPSAVPEASDADSVLQNMILSDNVFNFTPQAFATAQTQLNQLIQDHGGLTTSSADQQLLSQIFGATPNSITNSSSANSGTTNSAIQSTPPAIVPPVSTQSLPSASNESILVSASPTMSITNNHSSNNISATTTTTTTTTSTSATTTTASQATVTQKPGAKAELVGDSLPGLPPLGPDSLVITNNNGVPTLVASPALMQYLQTHQGIIQFQHDPVTKTIQPSLIIPHPQHKIEPVPTPMQDKMAAVVPNNLRTPNSQGQEVGKVSAQLKTSVGTITTPEIQKTNLNNLVSPMNTSMTNPNLVKVNTVKYVKGNQSLLQIATETNNLIGYKERNKTLTDKEIAEIDKKILQNRTILDQYLVTDNNRTNAGTVQNVIVKDIHGVGKEGGVATLQVAAPTPDKLFVGPEKANETQTLEDLQNLDMTFIKGFHPVANTNSPSANSDFQAKFLESIGMANRTPSKATVSVGTATVSSTVSPGQGAQQSTAASAKRGRKKKEKIVNQGIQADVKTDMPGLTFNIAELTPEQNVRLNQALQSRGAIVNQIENLDAIKQIIHEEVRKITSNPVENSNIRFVGSANLNLDTQEVSAAPAEQGLTTANVVISNPNLNQLLDQQATGQGNVISLQGNELIAINSGNQQIFAPQNQVLAGNHFVSSNNQILAIGGSHNQLVSLGNPINSSNQIVTLGNSTNLMSVGGSNVAASPGAVIVGGNGNVVAIVHQNAPPGQNPGIVQRIQTIQLTTPKQQHLKAIQSQIQTLSSKSSRSAAEQATLQRLILEQQKILSTGKLVQAIPGQQIQGMQIVSQAIPNATGRLHQTQATSQQPQQQQSQSSQLSQALPQTQSNTAPLQTSQAHTFLTANVSSQPSKSNFTTQTVVTCGTNTSDFGSSFGSSNIPKVSVPPTVLISDVPTSNYGPLYVSPNASGKNVTKCEKGTSPIQIQMGTQTVTNMEFRSGKMSTGTMTSPNTGKPQAVVAPAIVIQQTETPSPNYQLKPRNQTTVTEPVRTQAPTLSRTAFIEQQMRTDQAGATMPDTKTPFLSKSDACKRLLRYHVMDEKALSPQDLATADEIFEATAQHLLDKFRVMKEKYKYLLMLESMREVSTAERIMVDRNFIIEERMELEELREKEKRLQEEFENPIVVYRNAVDSAPVIKTEFTLDDVKKEMTDLMGPDEIKCEVGEDLVDGGVPIKEEKDSMISNSKSISDINSDSLRDNCSFKLSEANRSEDYAKIKSETKECKNTRTGIADPWKLEPVDGLKVEEEDEEVGGGKCKPITSRTFSEGSSKSSLDGSRDEDSGADINAQVQSAIDSILNLQRCEIMGGGDSAGDGDVKRSKKKRKSGDKTSLSGSKKSKTKEFGVEKREETSPSDGSGDDDDVDGGDADGGEDDDAGSDADPILDEAIRSILTS